MKDEIEKALKTPKSLHITRVPHEAREYFIRLAENKFANDWGATLAYLIEMYSFWLPKIYELECRTNALEKPKTDIKPKQVTTIGGKVLDTGGGMK